MMNYVAVSFLLHILASIVALNWLVLLLDTVFSSVICLLPLVAIQFFVQFALLLENRGVQELHPLIFLEYLS